MFFLRPCNKLFSPIGERQLVGGFMSFVAPMALCNLSASLCAISDGLALGSMPAPLRIDDAMLVDTRAKSRANMVLTDRAAVLLSIFIRMPSSTPWGCGLISFG